jgi:hypothetical protein
MLGPMQSRPLLVSALICDAADMPAAKVNNLHCYEELVAAAPSDHG